MESSDEAVVKRTIFMLQKYIKVNEEKTKKYGIYIQIYIYIFFLFFFFFFFFIFYNINIYILIRKISLY